MAVSRSVPVPSRTKLSTAGPQNGAVSVPYSTLEFKLTLTNVWLRLTENAGVSHRRTIMSTFLSSNHLFSVLHRSQRSDAQYKTKYRRSSLKMIYFPNRCLDPSPGHHFGRYVQSEHKRSLLIGTLLRLKLSFFPLCEVALAYVQK